MLLQGRATVIAALTNSWQAGGKINVIWGNHCRFFAGIGPDVAA
jgi:hypothetical protein